MESDTPFRAWKNAEPLRLAQIVFPTALDGTFDYLLPETLEGQLFPGMRVMVPLGKANRPTLGYFIGESVKTVDVKERARLKTIQSTVDSERLLSAKMLDLARWIADYYFCPLGTVLEAMLPAGVRGQAATRLTTVLYVCDDFQKKIDTLQKLQTGKKDEPLLTKKQLYVLETLRKNAEPLSTSELCRAAKCSQVPIQALKRLGLIRVKTIRRETAPKVLDAPPVNPADLLAHTLNPEQQRAFDTIIDSVRNMTHRTFLLHGVTGSGKTEVYIRAIEQVVRFDKQAIVLVPEISLTPQTVGRFKGRFPDVAVLHSHLTDAERSRQWNRIARGEIQVVVGARSAIFAPVPRLGLIIIDEEHENSFKQDSAPRYHTRDVARRRAEMESVPLVLGSATPSLESWHHAKTGDFTLISMHHRVRGRELPPVKIVDLREAVRSRETKGAIHRQLHAAIADSLRRQEQVILLLNRRGFSTQIQCPACGKAVRCPDCDVSLTHHRTEEIALCHYCDHQIPAPTKCPEPNCGFLGIRYSGFGTQKLEMEIKNRFPDATVLRMDTDTMQGHGAHERALARFRSGEIQILLGTQMIAKGLDFPNVTLVGVINADTALHLPDFRASERTFHLITQVAGRTGRGEKEGRVIVQTFSPDHPAILAASRHDYLQFVEKELPLREVLDYPPYSKMLRVVFRGPDEQATKRFAEEFTAKLRRELETKQGAKFRLLGPAPAPFAKLRALYRFHIHLHIHDTELMRRALSQTITGTKTPDQIQWIVDIDPLDML